MINAISESLHEHFLKLS